MVGASEINRRIIPNKYGGINDTATGWTADNKRIYKLWFGMLRRCYDENQQRRTRGRSYIGCKVCDEWMFLSNFSSDIKALPGYLGWSNGELMVLDKDTIKPGNREYQKTACCFIGKKENGIDVMKRHPELRNNLAPRFQDRPYSIHKNGKTITFGSEREACLFLEVKQCSVASCYMRKRKCKGYEISRGARMDAQTDQRPETGEGEKDG